MKKIFIAAAVLFASFTPAYAILAPLNQSVKEIQTILNSPELSQNLPPAETIQVIHHIESGYLIFTNNYQMFVELQFTKQQNYPGPRAFNLVFHPPTKLTTGK